MVERLILHMMVQVAVALSKEWKPATVEGLPDVFTGGWVGYCGYDTVRYVYSSKKLPLQKHICFCVEHLCATTAGSGVKSTCAVPETQRVSLGVTITLSTHAGGFWSMHMLACKCCGAN